MAGAHPLSDKDARALRLVARRTWRFFETFVTANDHMLPPDNFQEEPQPVLAHRTSPTNLGLYLLSVVAACDFGWLGKIEMAERIEATLGTMNGLERFRGHFYNWYDTHDLRPLEPKYISSVDSGNLAGHLIALGNACREMVGAPLTGLEWLAGIDDALEITRESLRELADDRRTLTVTRKHLEDALEALSTTVSAYLGAVGGAGLPDASGADAGKASGRAPASPAGLIGRMAELVLRAETLTDIARTLSAERGDEASAEVLACAEAVKVSLQSHQRDFEELMPWAKLVAAETALAAPANVAIDRSPEQSLARLFDSIPTLADLPKRLRIRRAHPDGTPGGACHAERCRGRVAQDASGRFARRSQALCKYRAGVQGTSRGARRLDEETVRRDGFRLSLQPGAPAPRDRVSRYGGQSRCQLL